MPLLLERLTSLAALAAASVCALALQGCGQAGLAQTQSAASTPPGPLAVEISGRGRSGLKESLLQLQGGMPPDEGADREGEPSDSLRQRGSEHEDALDQPNAEVAEDAAVSVAESKGEPVNPPRRLKRGQGWASTLQQEDFVQQKELQDEYNKMLYMDDPDAIDQAMKKAWGRMADEDKALTSSILSTGSGDIEDPSPHRHHARHPRFQHHPAHKRHLMLNRHRVRRSAHQHEREHAHHRGHRDRSFSLAQEASAPKKPTGGSKPASSPAGGATASLAQEAANAEDIDFF